MTVKRSQTFVLAVFCSLLCKGLCAPVWKNSTHKTGLFYYYWSPYKSGSNSVRKCVPRLSDCDWHYIWTLMFHTADGTCHCNDDTKGCLITPETATTTPGPAPPPEPYFDPECCDYTSPKYYSIGAISVCSLLGEHTAFCFLFCFLFHTEGRAMLCNSVLYRALRFMMMNK